MENFTYRPNQNNYYPPSRPNFHNRPAFRAPSPRNRFSGPPFHPYNIARAPALTPNALRMYPPHMQPPPMFGPRGSTLPPHLLNNQPNFRPRTPMPIDRREEYTRNTNGHEKNTFWCETCDREFKTAEILESHKAQHQKCNIDGCKFVAHPKIITKHIQMQHSTGLYKKIAKLDTPEEIEKWIAERKKKFPTKSNIDKKKAELEEKIKRGEKMGFNGGRFDHKKRNDMRGKQNNFAKGDNYKNQNRGANNWKNQENKKKNLKKVRPVIAKVEIKKNEEIINMNLRAFKGLDEIAKFDLEEESKQLPIQTDLTFADDDEHWVQSKLTNSTSLSREKNSNVCSALSALMDTYGSSDDDNEFNSEGLINKPTSQNVQSYKKGNSVKENVADESEDIPQNNLDITKSENNVDLTPKIIRDISSKEDDVFNDCDDTAPDEIKSVKVLTGPPSCNVEEKETTNENIPPMKRQRKHNNGASKDTDSSQNNNNKFDNTRNEPNGKFNRPKTFIRKAPSTLLEKLLASEIRHERNVVLQCIRHIVKNNYFKNVNK